MANQTESQHFMRLRTMTSAEFFRVPIDLSLKGLTGQSLLHEAIAFDKADIASHLVELGHALDVQNYKGETPLHYAAMFGRAPIVGLLLGAGADPNLTDKHGNGPIWYATTFPPLSQPMRIEIIRTLLRQGADPRHVNRYGKSPREVATRNGLEGPYIEHENGAV